MIRKMVRAKLLERQTTTNDYNETIEKWVEVDKPIEVAISVNTGTSQEQNSVFSVQSTHTGFTTDKRVMEQDKIKDGNNIYKVDYVMKSIRYNILSLTQEGEINDSKL